MVKSSRIFEGFKSVGFVSAHVPHIVRYVDKLSEIRVITACNNSFLVFNNKLKLIETCKLSSRLTTIIIYFSGVAHSSDITLLASDSRFVYTAAENEIFGWKYGHRWVFSSQQLICLFFTFISIEIQIICRLSWKS